MTSQHPPREIMGRFSPLDAITGITTLGQGNINDTFLLHREIKPIVLQRINEQVFPNPQVLIDNLHHLSRHLLSLPDTGNRPWKETLLIPALDGSLAVRDSKGALWRALSYIENSISFLHAETGQQAEQTGWALGHFHKRIMGLDKNTIQVPLPGFHHLSGYLNNYAQLSSNLPHPPSPAVQYCVQLIEAEQNTALGLERAFARGTVQQHIIHGDPKIANVLFDTKHHLAISLIDLDTVGPGLLQHDIGDCLRSVCNRGGEESDPTRVSYDLELCARTLKRYFEAAGDLLSPQDRELIFEGVLAISFELGLRFFIDYLQGGIYFKCKTPQETLQKALVQFTLFEDIQSKENAIRTFCQET